MELKLSKNQCYGEDYGTFNRTAYGIEIIFGGLYRLHCSALLIAPLMELKFG
mgnify:CR=1 FL=1